MSYNNVKNKSFIDEIYENKREEYERIVDMKNEENRNVSIINELLEKLEDCCKEELPKEVKKEMIKLCDELDRAIGDELDFWQRKFYKLGFINGMKLSEELKIDIESMPEDEE